jgi:hypothetical protein
MSNIFEQIKRDKVNQNSRKMKVSKFEIEILQKQRLENIQNQRKLKEEQTEMETRISCLRCEMEELARVGQQLADGLQDFEIQAEVLTTIDTSVKRRNSKKTTTTTTTPQPQPQQTQVRSVSATRTRDTTTNPRYPCTEFYRNFGSNTNLYMKINNKHATIYGTVDVSRRLIVSAVALGPAQKTEFRSFNEWVLAYISSFEEGAKTCASAYSCIWFQDNLTNQWTSLMTTAVVGNVINTL